MTIEQTIDIPASRRAILNVPLTVLLLPIEKTIAKATDRRNIP
jgi:hypothetical protein